MKKVLCIVFALMMTAMCVFAGGCAKTEAPAAQDGAASQPASEPAAEPASEPAAEPAASGEPIKVGLVGCHTGDYAVYGLAVRNGAMLYIDQVNAAGGINGKQIETIVYDNKGDTTEAVTAFSREVDEGITAFIGDVLTAQTIAIAGEANAINMPMITASATAEAVTVDETTGEVLTNVFRTCFIDPFQGEKMAAYAAEVLGAKTAAMIVNTSDAYSVGLANAFAATPSPSRMRAKSRCSVPTYIWPRFLASSWARLMTLRALSVNFSNMWVVPFRASPADGAECAM